MDIADGRDSASKGVFTSALSDEHQRNWTDEQWQRKMNEGGCNYDCTREKLNFEVTKGGAIRSIDRNKSIPQRYQERLRELGIADPDYKVDPRTGERIATNRRTTVKIVFQGSRDRMHELAYGNQTVNLERGADNSHITRHQDIEHWAQDIYQFACKQWGEDNILGFYCHLDETNPHIHCTVLPVAKIKGKMGVSFNKVFWGLRNKAAVLSRLHDDLAKVNTKWGLERGDSVALTGAVHKSAKEYRSEQANLDTELRKQRNAVKGLETMIRNLISEREALTEQLELMRKESVESFSRKEVEIHKLLAKIDKLNEQLDDKRYKLNQANANLNDIFNKLALAQQTKQQIETANQHALHVSSPARNFAADIALRAFVDTMQNVWENTRTTVSEDQYMDDSFAGAMLCDFANIVSCATLLFAGFIDEATNFAESNGGGGSKSDLPWRDKDDDERLWMLKCMNAAYHLMRPKGGYKTRRSASGYRR